MNENVLDGLLTVLDKALEFNSDAMEKPIALLWPDENCEWESVIPEIQTLRNVVSYGEVDAQLRRGPAYWLRCVIAKTIEIDGAAEGTPIIYLPGVARKHLSTIENAPKNLSSLAALQYRSAWFTHANGKDWTVRALLIQKDNGFNFDIPGDAATIDVLPKCLSHLLHEPIDRLKHKRIDASFLNGLLSPDVIRNLLNWLNNPVGTKGSLGDDNWEAFRHLCQSDFNFDPSSDGEIEGARRLGKRSGDWNKAWLRFREAPRDFPNLPDLLGRAAPSELLPPQPGSWPGLAKNAEDILRASLLDLSGKTGQEARLALTRLELANAERRGYVWADLGRTPLALALEFLNEVSTLSATALSLSTVDSISTWYQDAGWLVDAAALDALAEVETKEDVDAVGAALSAVYRPWLDMAARALQEAVGPAANSGNYKATPHAKLAKGAVTMFIDGLRLDVAHLVENGLKNEGLYTELVGGLAALPTVTQTSKPALVPIDQAQLGPGPELSARRMPDGPKAEVEVLRNLMKKDDIQVLGIHDLGDPTGRAWTEAGTIDHEGHNLGIKLARQIPSEVSAIVARVKNLLENGWSEVTIVTDHGWLLLPGGLPKNGDLPAAVAETKKGRCARVKDMADVIVPTVPWHWDKDVRIAVAPGISCFTENQVYEHGGVSPQECVVPRLTVRAGSKKAAEVSLRSLKWSRLMLSIELDGLPSEAKVQLRSKAADAETIIAKGARVTSGDGVSLLAVGNEDLEGTEAYAVAVMPDGQLLWERKTTIGENL